MNIIAGVDEAGRGALAGPVVAGVVVLGVGADFFCDLPETLQDLNDSKQLTATQRSRLFDIIVSQYDYGVGIVCAAEIDQIGIKKANHKAMMLAVSALKKNPDTLLIDGCDGFVFLVPSYDIVRGDETVPAIAAASIIAKVTRDKLMRAYDKKFPEFGFGSHKGYGAAKHRALLEQGIYCNLHRKSYEPLKTWIHQGKLF
jgi:ribonuclease HII